MNMIRHKLTNAQWLQAAATPQLSRNQTAGTRVTNLADLGKAIQLCYLCSNKFDFKKYHYILHYLNKWVGHIIGDCDGCRRNWVKCKLFTKDQQI